MEGFREAPSGIFCRAVGPYSTRAAVREGRQIILNHLVVHSVIDEPVSCKRPDPNNGSSLAGTHVRQEGPSDVQTPENIRVELFVSLFRAGKGRN